VLSLRFKQDRAKGDLRDPVVDVRAAREIVAIISRRNCYPVDGRIGRDIGKNGASFFLLSPAASLRAG
jgi:hypothetical protein